MPLGDYNNNNDNNKYYEPVLYSPYNTSNVDGVDPSALSFQFFRGLLKISISPMKPGAKPGDTGLWDHDNAASVWLTHTKAKILADEIRYVMAHKEEINNAGVPSGAEGLISFSTGKELGATSPCLIIRKIDKETGKPHASYAYQFKTETYYSIRNFNPDSADFSKSYYENTEIDQLLVMLDDYARSIGGAQAYANLYAMKFDIQRNNTKIKMIMDKLGIESQPSTQYSNSGTSYFNRQMQQTDNSSSLNIRNATFESIENELG